MTTTVTDPKTTWAVTAVAHPALRGVNAICPDCLGLTDQAITMARVTGSTGATASDSRMAEDENHSVTVTRVLALVTEEA